MNKHILVAKIESLPRSLLAGLILLCIVGDYFLVFIREFHGLDARLLYNQQDIINLFTELGPMGCRTYFLQEFVDLLLLSAYTILALRFASYLAQRDGKSISTLGLILCVLPGFADLVETLGIMTLLKSFPPLNSILALIIMIATPLKWMFGAVMFIYFGYLFRKTAPIALHK